MIDAWKYGVVPDGTDVTQALNRLIAFAQGSEAIHLPPTPNGSALRISGPLNCKAGITRIFGEKREFTTIMQTADNTPIFQTGPAAEVSGMTLAYENPQPIGNTDANAIAHYATNFGRFSNLSLYRTNRGLFTAQEAVSEGANWAFSTRYEDIIIPYFSNNGINLSAFAGGNSGSVLSNIYISGRDDAAVSLETNEALVLAGWANGALEQINVESVKPTQAMYFNTCSGLSMRSIHFEQVECRSNYGGFMDFAGGVHSIDNLTVRINTVSVPDSMAIVRASAPGTKVQIRGLSEGDNTVSTSAWRGFFLPADETGCDLSAYMVDKSSGLVAGYSATGAITHFA